MADDTLEYVGLGLYWNELSVGQRFRTINRTITETDLVNFINATGLVEVIFTDVTFGAQDEPGLAAFREALDLIQRGEIDMAPFVTHIFPLSRVREAFELAHDPRDGALKVSLRIE